MDFMEQIREAARTPHKQLFRAVASLDGELAVSVTDMDFALNCTVPELRMIATAAHARYREVLSAGTPEEGKRDV